MSGAITRRQTCDSPDRMSLADRFVSEVCFKKNPLLIEKRVRVFHPIGKAFCNSSLKLPGISCIDNLKSLTIR